MRPEIHALASRMRKKATMPVTRVCLLFRSTNPMISFRGMIEAMIQPGISLPVIFR